MRLRARRIEATLRPWHGRLRDGKTARGDDAVGSRRAVCGTGNGRRRLRHGGVASCARAARPHGDGSLNNSRRIHFPRPDLRRTAGSSGSEPVPSPTGLGNYGGARGSSEVCAGGLEDVRCCGMFEMQACGGMADKVPWGYDEVVTVVDPAHEEAGSSIRIYARHVGMEVAICRWGGGRGH